MINIKKYGKFKPIGNQKKKKQIILCHTSREVGEYLSSLNFRYNGSFNRIPNYVVKRDGEILQLLSPTNYTNYFTDNSINMNSVIITLENLGWLEKKPLSNDYINWKGSIYNKEVYEKKWRDYFFWESYTDAQYKSTADLCNQLIDTLRIKNRCVSHNTKINGIENSEGIVSKSNFSSKFTDLNPSFNFENFRNLLGHE